MKFAKLLHNPGAGDEEHSKEELIALIEDSGFECRYSSTKKKGWNDIEPDTDLLVIAGGDGTVRDIAEELLDRKVLEGSWPLGLLPLGTANNIAKTLGLTGTTKEIVESWDKDKVKKFDIGMISGVPDATFFLESFGYGIFPYLMREMKKRGKEDIDSPEKKIQAALKLLYEIVESYEPRYCKLEVDGTDHSGKFLMAEVMNTRSIGPNLVLSPLGDPGDGELEVVLVPEKHKDKLLDFVLCKMKGLEETNVFHILKAKEVNISWEGTHVHVDDEVVKIDKATKVKVRVQEGVLEFLVP